MPSTLLGLDYPDRRPRPRLDDVAWAEFGLRFVDLMAGPLPAVSNGRGYAAELLATAGTDPHDVAAVAGNCAAAPLAQEVARLVVEAGATPPALILVSPDPCGPDSVLSAYDECVAQLGSPPDPGRADLTTVLATDPGAFPTAALGALAAHVRDGLHREGVPNREQGPLAAGLLDAFGSYLTYLVAAHTGGRPPWGGDAHCLITAGASDGVVGWEGALRTYVHEVAAANGGVLGSPGLTAALGPLLAGIRS